MATETYGWALVSQPWRVRHGGTYRLSGKRAREDIVASAWGSEVVSYGHGTVIARCLIAGNPFLSNPDTGGNRTVRLIWTHESRENMRRFALRCCEECAALAAQDRVPLGPYVLASLKLLSDPTATPTQLEAMRVNVQAQVRTTTGKASLVYRMIWGAYCQLPHTALGGVLDYYALYLQNSGRVETKDHGLGILNQALTALWLECQPDSHQEPIIMPVMPWRVQKWGYR